ncbi:TIGR00730 family Rossman fold protein [Staphylococcus carnosus]|uniref:Cytokinin riboside 5'-monophosphate phosphoribohydrolase n=1 Tax=Staphylococcus carnosus TaxID=1281 RepID=A0AAJ0NHA2_STACA|nr:TIGR00730 family Rossman fold protein [Staphylococcus carnosus]KKB25394.1 lysine decarboxylase [Staphylococcus carnosus]POA02982.1 TIGR00730 family Rossman fold protein [Staphylococcus carnosus]QQS84515.1 TIGR00730 family Rossman fold protein [Staphylococcus carnosus]QRQ04455.1 TIGR00730 family Rossman fold protein [Staphylococcus carnosus]UTB83546.1 Rossman fold protein, TIGR00730 family [Staphylococcus carnosus]
MNIIVYCGASEGNNPIYKEATVSLGKWMSKQNYGLVFGGGKVGLMGTLADTVKAHGGHAIGIMPQFLADREIAHEGLDELIIVDTMAERKAAMLERGNVCLALPGGPGTLEEITEMVSWSRIGQNNNPCVFWNVNGYYDKIQSFYNQMVEEGFLSQDDRNLMCFTNDYDELIQFVECYQSPNIRQY